MALNGTDCGRSGIGRYVRAVLPRIATKISAAGGSMVALGTQRDLASYSDVMGATEHLRIPEACNHAGLGALWHLMCARGKGHRTRADVLLLLAANRRITMRPGLPTVGVVHDLAQLHVPQKYDAARMFYATRVIVNGLRTIDQLVATSNRTRDDIVRAIRVPPSAVRVVYAGVETSERRAANAPTIPPPLPDHFTRSYLFYPARLEHPGKNHVRLLKAFAQSGAGKTHQLVFAGADWGAEKRIRDEITRHGLDGTVLLLGYVSDECLATLFASADAVLVVGLHEGFGMQVLEALAAGRPVLASQTGATLESAGGLAAECDPYSEASISAALDRVVADRSLRQRAAIEGPAWARRWSWDRTADGLIDACLAATSR